MFNNKSINRMNTIKEIEHLREEVNDLTNRIWLLENPAKFKKGDKVTYSQNKTPQDAEILGMNKTKTIWKRAYYIRLCDDTITCVSEHVLTIKE